MKLAIVTVLHNTANLAMARGYMDGDFLEPAWTMKVRLDAEKFDFDALCNEVYRVCNVQHEFKTANSYIGRSMTIGDVIEIRFNDRVYLLSCEMDHWAKISVDLTRTH